MRYKEACELLEVNNDVSIQNIKKQYRMMALKYHPDKHIPDIDSFYENKFKNINESYAFLNHYLESNNNHEKENNDYNSLFGDFLSSFGFPPR